MIIFRKGSSEKRKPGASNFYSLHRSSRTTQTPPTSIPAPINDLCGPHVSMNRVTPGLRVSLESLQKETEKENPTHA